MNAIIYDIEIKGCIPDKRNGSLDEVNPVTGQPYEYCGGWTDFRGMGIATLCAWDCLTNMPLVFDESTIGEFGELVNRRQIVSGFNVVKFDNQICKAFGVEIPNWKTFDIYREALIGNGIDPEQPTRGGRNMNEFARVNFGGAKTANGADAPKMFQRGEMMKLINYCLSDVMIERRLFMRAIEGTLIDPVTGNVLALNIPESLKAK